MWEIFVLMGHVAAERSRLAVICKPNNCCGIFGRWFLELYVLLTILEFSISSWSWLSIRDNWSFWYLGSFPIGSWVYAAALPLSGSEYIAAGDALPELIVGQRLGSNSLITIWYSHYKVSTVGFSKIMKQNIYCDNTRAATPTNQPTILFVPASLQTRTADDKYHSRIFWCRSFFNAFALSLACLGSIQKHF